MLTIFVGIDLCKTSGGHVAPVYVAAEKLGIRVIDVRHEVILYAKMKKESNENLSGNKFYYTPSSLPVLLRNSCSKLHG